ncbi:DUF4386 domain-containing protein [Demequina soli]|uniref:DUF4386 domain-containing protein n=1 Tax=Demequina soli TaxID=1638987 RepID=UPI0007801DA2|nr:DUF4386 domain-containing protein [Demequina soli]
MTTTASSTRLARWAGAGYLAIFALAIPTNFVVLDRLVTPDDPAATLAAIATHDGAMRFGIAAFLTIAVIDIAIAWALHVLLRRTGEQRSLLAAWLRLAYGVIFAGAVTFLAVALRVATGDTGLGDDARAAAVSTALAAFDAAWLIGLVAFGLHLALVGRILVGARLAPRALGVGLGIAGIAYVADTFAHVLVPDYAAIAGVMLVVVAVPSTVAEMWLTVWLLGGAERRGARSRTVRAEAVPA